VSSISTAENISTTLQDAVASMTAALAEPQIIPPAVAAFLPPLSDSAPVPTPSPVSSPVSAAVSSLQAPGLAVVLAPTSDPVSTAPTDVAPGGRADEAPPAPTAPDAVQPTSVGTVEMTSGPHPVPASAAVLLPVSAARRVAPRRLRSPTAETGRQRRPSLLAVPDGSPGSASKQRQDGASRSDASAPIGAGGGSRAIVPLGVGGGSIEPLFAKAHHRARSHDAAPPVPQLPGQGSDAASGASGHGSTSPGGQFAMALATFVFLLPALFHRLWDWGERRLRLLRAGRLERPG
jgi:hypothetical protein